jgi:hypothetical protein
VSPLSERRCWQGLGRETETELHHDSSTNALIRRYRAMR